MGLGEAKQVKSGAEDLNNSKELFYSIHKRGHGNDCAPEAASTHGPGVVLSRRQYLEGSRLKLA